MSKEVNTNRGYYRPGKNMYSNSFSHGSKSRSYTRDDLSGSENPNFTQNVDMRQPNYETTNYVPPYDSTWSSNTREAMQAPMNFFNSYPASSSNIGGARNLIGGEQYTYRSTDGIQGPVNTSKVVRSMYADSFVTYNISNQDPMPTLQQHKMERDNVNPMPLQNYSTQNFIPDFNISSGQSMIQNNEKNKSIKVIPAFESKGRPQNPDDPRFILFPKEPTFNVKIIGGVRIAKQVTKISYRKSLKGTTVYTIGRKGGSCKKALAEGKRKRALWWITQGKTIEEAIILCLRPYHEIYQDILDKKHSWGTPMMIRNLLERINKEGVYNPFIGRPQANDSETSDDSDDEAKEHNMSEDESNQCVLENYGQNSNNLMLGSLPTQDKLQNMPTQCETKNGSSQKASYDPKSHFLSSLADRNKPLPLNSESAFDLIHIRTDNYSHNSLADRNSCPISSKPESKLQYTKDYNPYTKVNTKTKTINPKEVIRGAALKRYHYWLNVGKTPEVAKALCVLKMKQIPLYQKIKGTAGTLKNFAKRSRYQDRFHGTLSIADTGASSIVDITGNCDNINETEKLENPQVESESFISENTVGSAHGLENPNTSKSHAMSYVNELEQYITSLKYKSKKYNRIMHPAAINKYKWWRHVGRTIKEAQKMCQYPFHRYRREHEEGVKIIDFKTFILEDESNLNIAEETAKCPPEFKGERKMRYIYWIKLGKTAKEATDLILEELKRQRRHNHCVARLKKRQEYLTTFRSSQRTCPSLTQSSQNKNNNCDSSSVSIIPTIQIQPTIHDLTKDTDDHDVAHTGDIIDTNRTEDDAKKQIEPATQLTNAEMIRFEWWKKQGKSEEEARNLCHKSTAVSEFLKTSYKKETDLTSNTYEGSKSHIPDPCQNLRREEISNKQIFGENAIKTDEMAETKFPQNIVEAQDGHNLPITQNLLVPNNLKEYEQGEFRVCLKANKDHIDIDNLEAIKNSLNLCMTDEDGIKIKRFNKRGNRVIITCLNEQTRDWLDKQIPTLVPWENAELEIVDEDEVPIDIIARFFVAFDTEAECSSVTPEKCMQELHKQNPDVGCDRWVVSKVEKKTNPIGFFVLGFIDKKSNDVLTSKNNKLKWFHQRKIKVNITSTNKKKSKVERGARAVLFVPKVPECRLHSSHQYLLNRLHKLNPNVGCDGWTIVQKRIEPDGAALLVRLNNASKHKVETIKKLHWYKSRSIEITIVPIYVEINLPINNENKYLRSVPQNQITKTLINKLHFFNPSFGCLKWVVLLLHDMGDEWHLTFKINEHCHQTLIKSDYKLYWYGGRWLEIKLGTVPELEMFESKKDTKNSKKPATSYQPKENITKRNVNQIASGSLLSPQLTFNEESKVQDGSNRKLSMLSNNPENHPDIAILSSSRQDCTTGVSYTEREPYRYERHNKVDSVCNDNETHQLSPALEYALPEIPEYAKSPNGNLGLVGFGEKEDVSQERYFHGIRRYDEDRDTCSEDIYRLESDRDGLYRNTEHKSIENVDYNNDGCNQNYYYHENRLEEKRGHTFYPNSDKVNPDPRSNGEYLKQDNVDYHFDQHLHDRVDRRENYYVREERKFVRGEGHVDREENNLNREERNYNTEEKYYSREGINYERDQGYFDREKSPQGGDRLDFEHRSRQETEYSQRGWSPDQQNRNKYVERRKPSHSRDNQWKQKQPHLRPEHRESLHDSRERLNHNELARASEDRRHDALIDRLKGLANYHDRQYQYESSSYSSREWQSSRPSFDEPPYKRKRRRR